MDLASCHVREINSIIVYIHIIEESSIFYRISVADISCFNVYFNQFINIGYIEFAIGDSHTFGRINSRDPFLLYNITFFVYDTDGTFAIFFCGIAIDVSNIDGACRFIIQHRFISDQSIISLP